MFKQLISTLGPARAAWRGERLVADESMREEILLHFPYGLVSLKKYTWT